METRYYCFIDSQKGRSLYLFPKGICWVTFQPVRFFYIIFLFHPKSKRKTECPYPLSFGMFLHQCTVLHARQHSTLHQFSFPYIFSNKSSYCSFRHLLIWFLQSSRFRVLTQLFKTKMSDKKQQRFFCILILKKYRVSVVEARYFLLIPLFMCIFKVFDIETKRNRLARFRFLFCK